MVILREGLCPGLTTDIITLLKKNHVRTVVDLVASDLEELARKCSLSYKTLVAVRRVLLAQYSAFPSNGADLYEELKASTAILPTGNKKLDFLLDSGLYTGEVTEIAGAPGSALDASSDVDTDNEGNFEDNLSSVESDADLDATTDTDSEQSAILSDTGNANSSDDEDDDEDSSGEILGKDG
ncbi:unnamed protein product [Ranitomeya imitator]|uniref:RAD51D N-terminal domain-containing protein n=1 Tax=Ranitomeya imitator TaxID=111125 RepID=A0ABN9L4P0_9NEOB|nr:unnamed protein product [Ranitomeya imitator]